MKDTELMENASVERKKSKTKRKNEQENMKDVELMENAPSERKKSKKKHKNEQEDMKDIELMEKSPIERKKSKKKHKNEQENMKDTELMENASIERKKSKTKRKNEQENIKNAELMENAPSERKKSMKKHKNEQEDMKDIELMENAPIERKKSKKKHKNEQENMKDTELMENASIERKKSKKKHNNEQENMKDTELMENAPIERKKSQTKRKNKRENMKDAELMENAPSEKKKSKKKHKNEQENMKDVELMENAPSGKNESKKKHKNEQENMKDAELMENAPSEKNKSKMKHKNGSSSAKQGNSVDDEINAPSDNRVKRNKSKKKSCVVDDSNACSDKEIEHAKKREKKKRKVAENGAATPNKSNKKVKFSDKDEIFTLPADSNIGSDKEDNLVRGKRFTKEEDEVLKQAVFHYIAKHNLGEEEGLDMVLNSKKHKEFKGCWREIGSQIPYRPYTACYYRAQVLFRRAKTRKWTQEEYDMILKHQEEHGNKWKDLAEELGKHRWHVKDTWRRIQLRNRKKGYWSQKEYQKLFDLVNKDLQSKVFEEKHSKHGMLRDNIPWTAISEEVSTRTQASCCMKWYDQLTSRMVAEGVWADVDDYVLISELYSLDANCIEDVDWDSILENRDGDLCRKRWNQMALHIGHHGNKSFSEQVEILAQRYCPHLLEAREAWDNKPRVP